MQFTRLRLSGFKSFLEPTDLLIEPGLTAIVGPNGCGKSNLLEAIRWVMGENRVKSLRGAGMDDVIFAGTDQRSARNLAEVVLVIDNRDGTAPISIVSGDELEVVRRIERDSGSAYRINGQDVRAKDVTLLFADMATGAHSPALVSQGRIGELINAKPENRRLVLEEAAGISGLHARRREAESRLRSAEGNLARLQDVMQAMASQMSALKRQARQAQRYKEISTDIEQAEGSLMVRHWREAADQVVALEARQREAARRVADRTGQAASASKAQTEFAATLPPLRDRVVEARAALQTVRIERDNRAAEQERRAAARARLDVQAEQILTDIAREHSQMQEAEESLSVVTVERERLQADHAGSDDAQAAARETLERAQSEASEAEAVFDQLSEQAAQARARRSSLASDRLMIERRRDHFQSEIARTDAELAALNAGAGNDSAVAVAQTALKDAKAAADQARAAVDRLTSALEAQSAERDACQGELAAIQARSKAITSEVDILRSRHVSTGDAEETVADRVSADTGFEAALAAAISFGGDAGSDGATDKFWQSYAPLGAPIWASGLTPLAPHVRVPDALARMIEATAVADDETAAALADTLERGCQIVTASGALWRWDGYVQRRAGDTAAAMRLRDMNRLDVLETDLREVRRTQADLEAALDAKQAACAETRNQLDTVRKDIDMHEAAATEAQRTLIKLEEEQSRLTAQRDRLSERLAQLRTDYETACKSLDDVEAQTASLPDQQALEADLAERRGRVEACRKTLSEARARFDGLERERSERAGRLKLLATNISAWQSRIEAAETQISALGDRQKDTERQLKALEIDPAKDAAELSALDDRIDARKRESSDAEEALAAAEQQAGAAEHTAREAGERLTEAREAAARAEAELEAGGTRRKDIAARIGERFGCAPTAVLEKVGLDPSAELPALVVLEGKLDKLKQERERLGAVNLRADEELVDVEEQLTHLGGEKGELEQAIQRLRKAIADLNREGRERLTKAFEEVNTHFGELFSTLFGGGEAHLSLTESDDPLNAGLEIFASPPGKKLQSLSLLSGGEQALTALSLIFAVFMTNPAPICVLDEVDAPLDDANVDRFCDLLEAMRAKTDTRFLIVTHNAVTMARMDRLFGVTMAERGVSTLVSVDLERAVQMVE